MTQQSTIQILNQHLGSQAIRIVDEQAGIFRCQKDFRNAPYKILYIDCSNIWISKDFNSKKLESYQERILQQDYYKQSGALQWNFYYAFITDQVSIGNNLLKKKEIEADALYTRKFVLSEDELDQWLTEIDALSKPSETVLEKDLSSIWINKLKENQLDAVFLDETYVSGVDNYLDNNPILSPKEEESEDEVGIDQKEIISFIKFIEIINYRNQPAKQYNFGKVNLIKGINGSGKTSLLEAIELILCGKTDRNPDSNNANTVLKAILDKNRILEFTPNNTRLFKGRDRIWYNNVGQKFNRLHVSFNKYNFYNTDSALLLSLDSDKSNIKKAFEDIALGEEVNFIETRLKGFYDRFYTSYNQYHKITNDYNKELEVEKKLIKELGELDKSPENFFKEVIHEADRIKWRIKNKESDKFIPLLESDLTMVKYHLQLIKNIIIWEKSISYNWVIKTTQEFTEINKLMISLNKQTKEQQSVINRIKKRLVEIKRINEILQRLSFYFNEQRINDLIGISSKITELETEVNRLNKTKQIIDEITIEELKDISTEISLNQFIWDLDERIKTSEIKLKNISDKKKKIEKEFNQLEKIISEIKSKGKEYIKLNPQATKCPLCHSDYPQGKLIFSIERSWDNIKSTQILEDIIKQINQHEKDLKLLQYKKEIIDKIKQIAFLLYGDSGNEITIIKIKEAIANNSAILKKAQEKLNRLTTLKDYFEQKGLNENSYHNLIEELALEGVVIKDATNFNQIQIATKNEIESLYNQDHVATSKLNKAIEKRGELLSNLGIDETVQTLQERLDNLASAKESFNEILNVMDFNKENRLTAMEKEIEKLQNIFERYKSIKKQRDEYDFRIKSATDKINLLNHDIKVNSIYRDRAKKACEIIEELQKTDSKSKFLRDFIEKNKKEISEIFKMIHSPKEFEGLSFEESGQIILKRKHYNELAHLSEISSGQRSALALSIFSALNKKLKNGPNILLFDDPISHIDDLNILSFFDFLRELAVNGDRQIFFATANENAAFLFKQKFDFLGMEDFKIIELNNYK